MKNSLVKICCFNKTSIFFFVALKRLFENNMILYLSNHVCRLKMIIITAAENFKNFTAGLTCYIKYNSILRLIRKGIFTGRIFQGNIIGFILRRHNFKGTHTIMQAFKTAYNL